MTETQPLQYPGVYITELPAFPNSVAGVATAVPLFIGYTEFAGDPAGAPLYGKPVLISSIAEYQSSFGGAVPNPSALIATPAGGTPDLTIPQSNGDDAEPWTQGANVIRIAPGSGPDKFDLYWQLQLFFANGGSTCYVISAGSYWAGQKPAVPVYPVPEAWIPGSIEATELLDALAAGANETGPTMIAIPEACQLDAADYSLVVNAMVQQATQLGDRMAILDLPGCLARHGQCFRRGQARALLALGFLAVADDVFRHDNAGIHQHASALRAHQVCRASYFATGSANHLDVHRVACGVS